MDNTTPRPPIITIMGHVDHGKTTLMDYIQKTKIVDKEAGGITQSIRAFHVDYNGNALTFIDTPGHATFEKMRARGAKISDIILLVVAADDGVKPQTKEVIALAQKDKIPMVVVINKIDLPNADIQKVKMELANNGVLLEGWGGDTVVAEVSAKTGKGIDTLLETLLLVAELEDLKVDTSVNDAIVLESYMDQKAGPESVVIIKSGRLSIGDYVLGDSLYGKIRALINDRGEKVQTAGVSMPVRLLGLEKVLQSGEELVASTDKAILEANKVKQEKIREEVIQEIQEEQTPLDILDALMKETKTKESKPELNIVLKTDFAGSLEAITSVLDTTTNENVDINIIKSGTGDVTESDVAYAKSVRAVIIAFNVSIPARVKSIAKNEKVIIMPYAIIYELIDDVVTAAESLIPPEMMEVYVGAAEVIDVFTLSNKSVIAGSIVKDGKMVRGYNCYVTRDDQRVHEGKIVSVRHFKDEVKDATKGTECGISVVPIFDFKKGDRINCVRIEKS